MKKLRLAGLAFAVGALALAGCAKHETSPPTAQAQTPYDPYVGKTFPLTPAVIAMRWQLLNPDVNSFTFRETDRVFESRAVPRSGAVWDLASASGFTMPADSFGGQSYAYAQFAERTYTNAMLVIRHGKVVFEDYRNRSEPMTRFLSMSMAKTVTSMLVGIALGEHKIASLDDPAEKYVPELKGSGYEGVTIRQILQMRSGVDYEERYDFGAHPSFAGHLHQDAIVLNKMRFAAGALETKRANAPGQHVQLFDAQHDGARLDSRERDRREAGDYTRDKLWGPLGAQADAFWLADGPPGQGRALNGMGFNATLRDLRPPRRADAARRQARRYAGRAGGLGEAGDDDAADRPAHGFGGGFPGYGYQIWQVDDEPGAFCAVGLAGQYIYVSPATDTVIVKLSYYPPVEPPTVTPETIGYFKAIAHTPDS